MSALLHPTFRQETLVSTPGPGRTVVVPVPASSAAANGGSSLNDGILQPAAGGLAFFSEHLLCTAASATSTAVEDDRGLLWQVENSAAGGTLHLAEARSSGTPVGGTPVSLHFPGHQLLPAVSLVTVPPGETELLLVVLLTSGHLASVTLLPRGGRSSSLLAALSPQAVHLFDVSTQLHPIGTPTSICSAAGHVCIGGSSGGVLCVPPGSLISHSFAAATASSTVSGSERTFELSDSGWGLRGLISGVWQRGRPPGVASISAIAGPASADEARAASSALSGQLLLVVYDDCTVRAWNVGRRSVAFTATLEPEAILGRPAGRLRPVFATASPAAAPGGTAPAELALVVQFESLDTAPPLRPIIAYAITTTAGRLAVRSRVPLVVQDATAATAAPVTAAKVAPDGVVWVVTKHQGRSRAAAYSCTTGEAVAVAALEGAVAPKAMGMELELWHSLLSRFADRAFSAEAQVLPQLLAPGTSCRAALRDTLTYYGSQLPQSDVDAATPDQCRTHVAAAVAAVALGRPDLSPGQCWLQLLTTYRDAWFRRHQLLGLVLHPQGWLGTVRGGGMLSSLRCTTRPEALHAAAGTSAEDALQAAVPPVLPGLTPAVRSVCRCATALGAALGPLVADACVGLAAAGVDLANELGPALADLLLSGPSSSSTSSSGAGGGSSSVAAATALSDVDREQRRLWRQRRQALLHTMGGQLGALTDPVGAIGQYCAMLTLDGPVTTSATAAVGSANSIGAAIADTAAGWTASTGELFLTCSARQVSRTQCTAGLDVLLLLQVVMRQLALGTALLPGAALAAAQGHLLPQVVTSLRRATLAHWLSSQLATRDHDSEMEPALEALSHLRLGSPSKAARAAGAADVSEAGRPGGGGRDATSGSLAGRLLVDYSHQRMMLCLGVVAGRDKWDRQDLSTLLFTTFLQYGEDASVGVAGRILQVGYNVFTLHQTAALAGLTQLAGPPSTRDAGPDFLRGLSLSCQLSHQHAGTNGAQRTQLVSEAAGCFFRAAASLKSEAGQTLREVLAELRHQLSVAGVEDDEQAPFLQLQFFEAIMMLFERERAPEGALMFARAALKAAAASYASCSRGEDQASQQQDGHAGNDGGLVAAAAAVASVARGKMAAERRLREGRLWSNVFSYSCEMHDYEGAYAALVSHTEPERSVECLRRLVHVLSEERQLATLVSLPFAGMVVLTDPVTGQAQLVPLLREVVQALQRRAHSLDITFKPQPYCVLYDLLVFRSDFRSAAEAMFAYARRLRAEGRAVRGVVETALAAYDSAINALSLVDSHDAWLDLSTPFMRAVPQPGGGSSHQQTDTQLLWAPNGRQQQQPAAANGAVAVVGAASNGSSAQFVTLEDVRKEAALMRAAASLAGVMKGVDALQQWGNAEDVFARLLSAGRYDDAVALAHAMWRGARLTSQLELAVAKLAKHCANVQLGNTDPGDMTASLAMPSSSHPPPLPPSASGRYSHTLGYSQAGPLGSHQLGSRAAPLWNQLAQLLLGHETVGVGTGGTVPPVQQQYASASTSASGSTPLQHAGALRCAAADAILRTDRRIALPPWLLNMFQAPDEVSRGMGGAASGPADLLAIYLRHERWADAVDLVEAAAAAWGRADARSRRKHHAAWMPYGRLQALRASLAEDAARPPPAAAGAGGSAPSQAAAAPQLLLQRLDAALAGHMELVEADTPSWSEHSAQQQQHMSTAGASTSFYGEAGGGGFSGDGFTGFGNGGGSEVGGGFGGFGGGTGLFGGGGGGGGEYSGGYNGGTRASGF